MREMHDELVGRVIGFHEFRVWVFQETYFARGLYIAEGTFESTSRQLFPWMKIPYPWVRLTAPGINTANEERALRLTNHLSDRCSARGYKSSIYRQEIHQAVDAGQAFMIKMGVLTLTSKESRRFRQGYRLNASDWWR